MGDHVDLAIRTVRSGENAESPMGEDLGEQRDSRNENCGGYCESLQMSVACKSQEGGGKQQKILFRHLRLTQSMSSHLDRANSDSSRTPKTNSLRVLIDPTCGMLDSQS